MRRLVQSDSSTSFLARRYEVSGLRRRVAGLEAAQRLAIEALEEIIELDSDDRRTAGELAAEIANRALRKLGN